MGNTKFNTKICENCKYFWTGLSDPECHFNGEHIFDGECIEYTPVKNNRHDDYSYGSKSYGSYEDYQSEWN